MIEEKNCKEYLKEQCFVKPPLLKVFSKKRSIIEIPIGSNWRRVFYNLLKNFSGDELMVSNSTSYASIPVDDQHFIYEDEPGVS